MIPHSGPPNTAQEPSSPTGNGHVEVGGTSGFDEAKRGLSEARAGGSVVRWLIWEQLLAEIGLFLSQQLCFSARSSSLNKHARVHLQLLHDSEVHARDNGAVHV